MSGLIALLRLANATPSLDQSLVVVYFNKKTAKIINFSTITLMIIENRVL